MATITIASRPPLQDPTAGVTAGSTEPITPTSEQIVVLYVVRIHFSLSNSFARTSKQMISMSVVIFGVWNVPGLRNLINPLKLFTIGLHEMSHIIAAVLSGGRILRITIDPHIGGATIVEGGRPGFILPAGYIGSTLFGGLFVLAGWDTLVAKVMSFVLAIGLLMPLRLVRDKFTILLTIFYEGLLIGFWFVDHASALRWYCLFVGMMNILYVIWDVADDRFFHKNNDSDTTQFEIMFPRIPQHVWATLWIMFSLIVLVGFALLGIFAFKRTTQEMYDEAAKFLPTR
ncbi:peptidase M50B-like-domain-containing protein [Mucidula mucida]|nr:peptidase M50B-like-domain-containing protein [Mucidula mucida]